MILNFFKKIIKLLYFFPEIFFRNTSTRRILFPDPIFVYSISRKFCPFELEEVYVILNCSIHLLISYFFKLRIFQLRKFCFVSAYMVLRAVVSATFHIQQNLDLIFALILLIIFFFTSPPRTQT